MAGWQCMFDQVLDQTIDSWLRVRTRGGGVGGLEVKALNQTVRDVGSSPALCYIFLLSISSL